MENYFFLKGKTMKQILNNFTILNRDYNTQRYNIKLCISHNFSYSLCFSLLFYFLSLTQFFKTIMSSLSQGLLTSPNGQMTFLLWIILYLWEPKMCRLTWLFLGMLGNVLGRPRHALQCPKHACNVLGVLGMLFCKVLGVPHRRKPPPTCCLISCEIKRVVYHQVSIYGSLV